MSGHAPPAGLSEQDFETIEDAVMETARGRWFLREYARRMRAADTNRLLEAISRIERTMAGQSAALGTNARTEFDLAALDERRDALLALAVGLREQGYDGGLCSRIEREAVALADVIDHVRDGDLAVVDEPVSLPAPKSSEATHELVDPHAASTLTIEAQALPRHVPPEIEVVETPETFEVEVDALVVPDPAALAAIESMPFRDKLALFT